MFDAITDADGNDMELASRPVDQLVVRPVGESNSQLDAAVKVLLASLPRR